LLQNFRRQGDAPDLAEHGRQLILPRPFELQNLHDLRDQRLALLAPPKGLGADQGQKLRQDLNAAPQSTLQQLPLGHDQTVLAQTVVYGAQQRFRGTGLGQKTKDRALIHGRHGRVQIPLAGEHDADRIGILALDQAQEFHPVHLRHFQIGDDHCKGSVGLQLLQRRHGPFGRLNLEMPVQIAPECCEHKFLVIHKKNSFAHTPSMATSVLVFVTG
jgi:hypothetical protein